MESRETLRRWIARENPVPAALAASIGRRVAEAVARRHAEGLPAGPGLDAGAIEIWWEPDGDPAVVLRSVEPAGGAQSDLAWDPADDIPGIGAVLYETLTGVPPPARRAPPPVRRTRPDVPDEVDAVVMECFRPGPEGRPRSAEEVARRLEPFEGVPLRTRPLSVSPLSTGSAAADADAERTVVRPLEDRTLARENLEEAASAAAPRDPGGRGRLYAGIFALAVAAGVFWLSVRTVVQRSPPPATARPAAAGAGSVATPVPTRLTSAVEVPSPAPTGVSVVEVAPPPGAPVLPSSPAAPAAPVTTAGPVATAAATGASPADAERLREALDAWVESTNAHDLSGHMRLYMPRVATFHRSKNVSSDFVWTEKARLFAGLAEVRVTRPDIRFGPDGRTATTTFKRRVVPPDRRGEVTYELDWVKTPRGWRIVGEREG